MLCERCHHAPARVHVRTETRGRRSSSNLCVVCATQVLGKDLAGAAVARLLGEVLVPPAPAPASPTTAPEPAAAAEPGCARCGLTLAEFRAEGRLGCAACYQAFAGELEQPVSPPLGPPVPGRLPAPVPGVQRQAMLRQLRQAVAEEAFERAAQIRDDLSRLG